MLALAYTQIDQIYYKQRAHTQAHKGRQTKLPTTAAAASENLQHFLSGRSSSSRSSKPKRKATNSLGRQFIMDNSNNKVVLEGAAK